MKRHHQNRLQLEKKIRAIKPTNNEANRDTVERMHNNMALAIGWLTEEQSVANRSE